MARIDDIADDLARQALELEAQTGDEGFIRRVADAIAGSSPTMEETFLTAVRIRRAELRARGVIDSFRKANSEG